MGVNGCKWWNGHSASIQTSNLFRDCIWRTLQFKQDDEKILSLIENARLRQWRWNKLILLWNARARLCWSRKLCNLSNLRIWESWRSWELTRTAWTQVFCPKNSSTHTATIGLAIAGTWSWEQLAGQAVCQRACEISRNENLISANKK